LDWKSPAKARFLEKQQNHRNTLADNHLKKTTQKRGFFGPKSSLVKKIAKSERGLFLI